LFNNSNITLDGMTSERYIANHKTKLLHRRRSMNHFRLLATGTILMFALICPAQQSAARSADSGEEQPQQSAADAHLRALSEKLDLSADQQVKIKPILEQMLAAREKIRQDGSLSSEARQEKQKSLHEKADKQLRQFLNEEQKRKLDQLEQEPHPGMHGN
jgi:transposase